MKGEGTKNSGKYIQMHFSTEDYKARSHDGPEQYYWYSIFMYILPSETGGHGMKEHRRERREDKYIYILY